MQDGTNILDRYLLESGSSISGLAAKIGRSPSTLSRALNGERNPSIKLAKDVERGTSGLVGAREFIAICLTAQAEKAAA